MSIIETIRSHEPEFSNAEKKLSQVILERPDLAADYTISQLADHADTSTSAVLRFCKTCGCSGFKEFHFHLVSWLSSRNSSDDLVMDLASQYASAAQELGNLDRRKLSQLAQKIRTADRVFSLGRFRNEACARRLQINLIDQQIDCHCGSDELEYQHLLYLVSSHSAVVFFSAVGDIRSCRETAEQIADHAGYSVLITANPRAELSALTDDSIILPSLENRTFSEQAVMLMFVDILSELVRHAQI
ncbi:MurR/RpiR family transcriptional regulator [Anaerolactibacter massiliensis]|uniref:MurR/RpiR family transcriptional regulator n=1 Tax=Anaerolactibacter massiliensis TaxID=2044573 RepID=UPI000CF8C64E|nr:MurR/RpiR family transcriptional regulator [Anaerolactibacter massiliensis]